MERRELLGIAFPNFVHGVNIEPVSKLDSGPK
jgi:hypothetical protein